MVTGSFVTPVFLAVFVAGGHGAQSSAPDCCAKAPKAVAGRVSEAKLRCSLTNKTVDKCCCVQKEGSLHCTLADKDVERCCCVPVEGATKKAPKK